MADEIPARAAEGTVWGLIPDIVQVNEKGQEVLSVRGMVQRRCPGREPIIRYGYARAGAPDELLSERPMVALILAAGGSAMARHAGRRWRLIRFRSV